MKSGASHLQVGQSRITTWPPGISVNYLRSEFCLYHNPNSSIAWMLPPTFPQRYWSPRAHPRKSHACNLLSQHWLAGKPYVVCSVTYYYFQTEKRALLKARHSREIWAYPGLWSRSTAIQPCILRNWNDNLRVRQDWIGLHGLEQELSADVILSHLVAHTYWIPLAHIYAAYTLWGFWFFSTRFHIYFQITQSLVL